MNFYYFKSKENNFGDLLTPDLIKKISKESNFSSIFQRKSKGILSLGSIFHFAKEGDTVWGTGINPYRQKEIPNNLRIKAVRGPLTRKYIQEHSNLDCPSIYGDPALLLPLFFPEFNNQEKIFDLTIIPHYLDVNHPELKERKEVISPSLPWKEVVERISKSKFVISSSLHGLIVADAYNIPSRWWNSTGTEREITEGTFKYNDFYLSTNRKTNLYGETIQKCIELGPVKRIEKFDYESLLKSFPTHLDSEK